MPGRRRARLLARLMAGPGDVDARRLCERSVEITATTGAGIMVMSGDVARGSLCSTDRVSGLIEELQFSLGEGPCVDAYNEDRPVMEGDLATAGLARWPVFAGPVLEAGAAAVFGFPLHMGRARLGALNLYRDAAGGLSDDQHADALVVADIVTQTVLLLQADAPAGQLAVELERGADLQLSAHQASGMVAAQLDISVTQALVRLRAYAFAHGRPLHEVAEAVVARTLVFDDTDGDGSS